MNDRHIGKIDFQILSPPEGRGNVLEFLDGHGDAFMEVNINDADEMHVKFYHTSRHIVIPLAELEKGIALAKERVKNVDAAEFEGN